MVSPVFVSAASGRLHVQLAAAPYLCQRQAAHAVRTKTVSGMCSAARAADTKTGLFKVESLEFLDFIQVIEFASR